MRCTVVDLAHAPCEATLSLNRSTPAVFVTGSTSGYLDRRSVTGGRCSLVVRVPAPLTVNVTLRSLVGAGVSLDRAGSPPVPASVRCPIELLIEDAARRHSSPVCPLSQPRQRSVYQSHDSQIRLYFTQRRRQHVQPLKPASQAAPRHHRHTAAFVVKIEGKSDNDVGASTGGRVHATFVQISSGEAPVLTS